MTSQRPFLGLVLLALHTALPAQTTAAGGAAASSPTATSSTPPPHFDLADVHPSPFANQPNTDIEYTPGGRFLARQATMVDLMAFAWNVDNNRILRGPAWLDFDRFDINARAPRGTSQDDFRLMLRALLADRLSLTTRADTKTLPAFVLTVAKGGVKMKPAAKSADGSDNHGCHSPDQPQNQTPGAPSYNILDCQGIPVKELADDLRGWAGGYVTNTVIDQTGLTGLYDFELKWTGHGQLARAGTDGISFFDAVDKQLGLKLEAKAVPLPVIFVDAANEKPTPNAPGLDKASLAPPPVEFEVAVLKPSAPDAKGENLGFNASELNITNVPLQDLITWIWNVDDQMLAGAPKWLNQDRWDIRAKFTHDPSAAARGQTEVTFDQLQASVKSLLIDRFGLQAHFEDRPADAYTLVAASPHMKKADPDNRTGCHNGPGPDGKDPRIANPILNRLLTCQNMTMAQFGDILRINASGYIHSPVLDKTGLTDAYDFTLSFSGIGQIQNAPKSADASTGAASAGDAGAPNGAVSLLDAVQKQMGVKLVKEKRPVQMLVIDRINQKPTDN
jgi:uncharacterized protein (TIGR03435 family)